MNVEVPEGKYIVAVSGGVDSMVLLDLLLKLKNLELIVAHFNHGIRSDSHKDEHLVRNAALKLGLPVEIGHGKLGSSASEEQARKARYDFLQNVKTKHQADKIITAHHQDDAVETAIINILRGTGRRGLSAIYSNPAMIRPLMNTPKSRIMQYALTNKITWHEDSTNADTGYLRNYVRLKIVPSISKQNKDRLLGHITEATISNRDIDMSIAKLSHKTSKGPVMDRQKFVLLPVEIGSEVVMHWLRENGIRLFDKKTINRLNIQLRTAKNGTLQPIAGGVVVEFYAKTALLSYR
jgi:tRNA(Ile)-lysidine synthetase-like protein